ncbi:hypothetical protein DLJ53_33590 [Acuticoccus sediminis]|uniref:Uncharacterized protein n=1 Tax=Acuticoccus sediminis TaxID=2184697 RepID=A0A8B2NJL1_9HYPH|nr:MULTISPECIES: PHB depolymerase family esterase [Acuticoccus]MCF3933347.1 prolyl oligopeptidase family serine peptidase [Acuticoccus kalidii]RAH95934.1 hypothetical protein DLJ53_33590 [Acuticoccus sediminis]
MGPAGRTLADRHGFALLFPQQRRQNNAFLGFNWVRRGDSRRNLGEPVSIVAMIRAVGAHCHCDPRRVFVTGLSSGGAMTSVLSDHGDGFPFLMRLTPFRRHRLAKAGVPVSVSAIR